jgi:hypothetical protein
VGGVGCGDVVCWRRRKRVWGRECSGLLPNVILQVTAHDTWRWLLDPIHGNSVGGAYHFITITGV